MGRMGLVAAVSLWAGVAGLLRGESPETENSPPPVHRYVAVLDVARTFKECRRFNEQMTLLKSEVAAADAVMKRRAEELQDMSKDDRTPESTVLKVREEMQQDIQAERKEFLRREAAIRGNAYREMIRQLEDYCYENGIEIVLNVSDPEWDSAELCCRLCDLPKKIYWYTNEITDEILERLNASSTKEPEPSENASADGG